MISFSFASPKGKHFQKQYFLFFFSCKFAKQTFYLKKLGPSSRVNFWGQTIFREHSLGETLDYHVFTVTSHSPTQLLNFLCAVRLFTVDRLRDGGLLRNGVQVPCMEGFSVCQNFLIFFTLTPDSCLSLSTQCSISSGVLFFTSTILLFPFTETWTIKKKSSIFQRIVYRNTKIAIPISMDRKFVMNRNP